MTRSISFTVLGKPEPQGSIRAFVVRGRPRLTSDNARLKPWRDRVGWAALEARGGAEVVFGRHVPVRVDYLFVLDAPKSRSKARREPSVRPDISKYVRGAEDALTGILYADDGQIVECYARKEYGAPARTEITVAAVERALG